MDYLDVPRCLIYRDRSDLNEFGVRTPRTLNCDLFERLKDLYILRIQGAQKYALECFNNAYYICTLIFLDEYPELRIADYGKKLLDTSKQCKYDVCAASMAMVWHLLHAFDNPTIITENCRENIYRMFKEGEWCNIKASETFYQMADSFDAGSFTLLPAAFARRDIIEAIENVSDDILAYQPSYVNELLSLEKDPQRLQYGLDLATNRVNNYLKNFDFLPPEDVDIDFPPSSFDIAHGAIDSYKKRKTLAMKDIEESAKINTPPPPSTPAENPDVASLQKQISELQQENDELKRLVDELKQPVENLTDAQKIRMELAFQLLGAAGMTDEVLKKWGNKQKTATVMSFLLDIHNNNARGNQAQTCATYITDRDLSRIRHQESIQEINTLLSELGISIQL